MQSDLRIRKLRPPNTVQMVYNDNGETLVQSLLPTRLLLLLVVVVVVVVVVVFSLAVQPSAGYGFLV
jgi:hypothetical protein